MKAAKNSLLAALMLCAGTPVLAATLPAVTMPLTVPVTADAQVRVALSNTAPNLIVVPGDRIIAVDSAQGMFINDNKALGQAGGGVELMTAQTTPFTFYLRTAGGLTLSVVAVPGKQDGRVLRFVSDRPVQHETARQWEASQPYTRTLVAIQKAVLAGKLPEGFTEALVAAMPPLSLPLSLSVQPEQMWSGGALRLYRLTVTNRGTVAMTLPERLFQAPGVRSVMVFPYTTTLLPTATISVWLTVSDVEEPEHGQKH